MINRFKRHRMVRQRIMNVFEERIDAQISGILGMERVLIGYSQSLSISPNLTLFTRKVKHHIFNIVFNESLFDFLDRRLDLMLTSPRECSESTDNNPQMRAEIPSANLDSVSRSNNTSSPNRIGTLVLQRGNSIENGAGFIKDRVEMYPKATLHSLTVINSPAEASKKNVQTMGTVGSTNPPLTRHHSMVAEYTRPVKPSLPIPRPIAKVNITYNNLSDYLFRKNTSIDLNTIPLSQRLTSIDKFSRSKSIIQTSPFYPIVLRAKHLMEAQFIPKLLEKHERQQMEGENAEMGDPVPSFTQLTDIASRISLPRTVKATKLFRKGVVLTNSVNAFRKGSVGEGPPSLSPPKKQRKFKRAASKLNIPSLDPPEHDTIEARIREVSKHNKLVSTFVKILKDKDRLFHLEFTSDFLNYLIIAFFEAVNQGRVSMELVK
jgi:hypothetical protein